MKNNPFARLFPPDLSDETVDHLFLFLHHLIDCFHEVYADQILRLMDKHFISPPEPPDDFYNTFDDDIPF